MRSRSKLTPCRPLSDEKPWIARRPNGHQACWNSCLSDSRFPQTHFARLLQADRSVPQRTNWLRIMSNQLPSNRPLRDNTQGTFLIAVFAALCALTVLVLQIVGGKNS